jgi:hypothetical protein
MGGPMSDEKPDLRTEDGILQERQRYISELGELLVSWNALQESFAELFCIVTGMPNNRIPSAIWHSIRSDKTQRDILTAAINVA